MKETLTPLEALLYDTVAEITNMKEGAVDPCAARMSEIHNSLNVEIKEALRELCRKGLLKYNVDINKNIMFSINKRI